MIADLLVSEEELIMEEQKKQERRGRWSYANDFRRAANGEYIYIGATYHFQGEKDIRKRGLFCWGILAVGMAVCAVLGGFILAPGTANCAYVLIPYVVAFLSACSVLWGFIRLAAGGDPLRSYVYKATVRQFSLRTILTAVGAAGAIAGELCYVAIYGTQGLVSGMVIFLVSEAVVLALSLLWRPLGRDMKWEYKEGAEG